MITENYNCRYFLSDIIGYDVFISVSILYIAAFSFFYLKYYLGSRFGDVGYLLILVGGLMNILERATKGCVRDYLNFFNLFHFNIYDIMVTTGILLISIAIWKKK